MDLPIGTWGVFFEVPSPMKPSPTEFVHGQLEFKEVVTELTSFLPWMDGGERAQFWQWVGEWALVEKKLPLAMGAMERSLISKESASVRKRWKDIRSQLGLEIHPIQSRSHHGAKGDLNLEGDVTPRPGSFKMTKGEQKLLNAMRKSLKSPTNAVPLAIQLLEKYPQGGGTKEVTRQVGKIFIRLGRKVRSLKSGKNKKDKNHRISLEHQHVLRWMLQSKGPWLYQWAQRAYKNELYKDAYQLAQGSYSVVHGGGGTSKALGLMGLSAFHAQQPKDAEEAWKTLTEQYISSEEAEEAMMRLGMLYYRQNKNVLAAAHLEKAIAMSKNTTFEVISRYWLWRSMERLQSSQDLSSSGRTSVGRASSDRASQVARELMDRFPLTYYGLRARMEQGQESGKSTNKNITSPALLTASSVVPIPWPPVSKKKIKAQLWLTETEMQSWERFQHLLGAGWFEEAQKELATLPEPTDHEGKLLWARLFALALDHHNAIIIATGVWEKAPQLLYGETLRLAYPLEYFTLVSKESQKYNIDPLLVLSLMKQESSFRKEVRSVSNAMGLMQLLEPTARDVARQLRKKVDLPSSLFQPSTNITLGVRYMRQMIRAFKGHVPLALAAYNTGIGHMRIWLRTRDELKGLQNKHSSHPDQEMWIDELPWSETSFYVKAILRNYILYRALEQKGLISHSPLWRAKSSHSN